MSAANTGGPSKQTAAQRKAAAQAAKQRAAAEQAAAAKKAGQSVSDYQRYAAVQASPIPLLPADRPSVDPVGSALRSDSAPTKAQVKSDEKAGEAAVKDQAAAAAELRRRLANSDNPQDAVRQREVLAHRGGSAEAKDMAGADTADVLLRSLGYTGNGTEQFNQDQQRVNQIYRIATGHDMTPAGLLDLMRSPAAHDPQALKILFSGGTPGSEIDPYLGASEQQIHGFGLQGLTDEQRKKMSYRNILSRALFNAFHGEGAVALVKATNATASREAAYLTIGRVNDAKATDGQMDTAATAGMLVAIMPITAQHASDIVGLQQWADENGTSFADSATYQQNQQNIKDTVANGLAALAQSPGGYANQHQQLLVTQKANGALDALATTRQFQLDMIKKFGLKDMQATGIINKTWADVIAKMQSNNDYALITSAAQAQGSDFAQGDQSFDLFNSVDTKTHKWANNRDGKNAQYAIERYTTALAKRAAYLNQNSTNKYMTGALPLVAWDQGGISANGQAVGVYNLALGTGDYMLGGSDASLSDHWMGRSKLGGLESVAGDLPAVGEQLIARTTGVIFGAGIGGILNQTKADLFAFDTLTGGQGTHWNDWSENMKQARDRLQNDNPTWLNIIDNDPNAREHLASKIGESAATWADFVSNVALDIIVTKRLGPMQGDYVRYVRARGLNAAGLVTRGAFETDPVIIGARQAIWENLKNGDIKAAIQAGRDNQADLALGERLYMKDEAGAWKRVPADHPDMPAGRGRSAGPPMKPDVPEDGAAQVPQHDPTLPDTNVVEGVHPVEMPETIKTEPAPKVNIGTPERPVPEGGATGGLRSRIAAGGTPAEAAPEAAPAAMIQHGWQEGGPTGSVGTGGAKFQVHADVEDGVPIRRIIIRQPHSEKPGLWGNEMHVHVKGDAGQVKWIKSFETGKAHAERAYTDALHILDEMGIYKMVRDVRESKAGKRWWEKVLTKSIKLPPGFHYEPGTEDAAWHLHPGTGTDLSTSAKESGDLGATDISHSNLGYIAKDGTTGAEDQAAARAAAMGRANAEQTGVPVVDTEAQAAEELPKRYSLYELVHHGHIDEATAKEMITQEAVDHNRLFSMTAAKTVPMNNRSLWGRFSQDSRIPLGMPHPIAWTNDQLHNLVGDMFDRVDKQWATEAGRFGAGGKLRAVTRELRRQFTRAANWHEIPVAHQEVENVGKLAQDSGMSQEEVRAIEERFLHAKANKDPADLLAIRNEIGDKYRAGAKPGAADAVEKIFSVAIDRSPEHGIWTRALADDPEHVFGPGGLMETRQWGVISPQTLEHAGNNRLIRGQMRLLQHELNKRGLRGIVQEGRYGGDPEASFLVPGLTPNEAREIGAMFHQESVLTNTGLLGAAEHTWNPATKAYDVPNELYGKIVPPSGPMLYGKEIEAGDRSLIRAGQKEVPLQQHSEEIYREHIDEVHNELQDFAKAQGTKYKIHVSFGPEGHGLQHGVRQDANDLFVHIPNPKTPVDYVVGLHELAHVEQDLRGALHKDSEFLTSGINEAQYRVEEEAQAWNMALKRAKGQIPQSVIDEMRSAHKTYVDDAIARGETTFSGPDFAKFMAQQARTKQLVENNHAWRMQLPDVNWDAGESFADHARDVGREDLLSKNFGQIKVMTQKEHLQRAMDLATSDQERETLQSMLDVAKDEPSPFLPEEIMQNFSVPEAGLPRQPKGIMGRLQWLNNAALGVSALNRRLILVTDPMLFFKHMTADTARRIVAEGGFRQTLMNASSTEQASFKAYLERNPDKAGVWNRLVNLTKNGELRFDVEYKGAAGGPGPAEHFWIDDAVHEAKRGRARQAAADLKEGKGLTLGRDAHVPANNRKLLVAAAYVDRRLMSGAYQAWKKSGTEGVENFFMNTREGRLVVEQENMPADHLARMVDENLGSMNLHDPSFLDDAFEVRQQAIRDGGDTRAALAAWMKRDPRHVPVSGHVQAEDFLNMGKQGFDKVTQDIVGAYLKMNKWNRDGLFRDMAAKHFNDFVKAGVDEHQAFNAAIGIARKINRYHMLDLADALKVEQTFRWASYFFTKHRLYRTWLMETMVNRPELAVAASHIIDSLESHADPNDPASAGKLTFHLPFIGEDGSFAGGRIPYTIPVARLFWLGNSQTQPGALAQAWHQISQGNWENMVPFTRNAATELTTVDTSLKYLWLNVDLRLGRIHSTDAVESYLNPSDLYKFKQAAARIDASYRIAHNGHPMDNGDLAAKTIQHMMLTGFWKGTGFSGGYIDDPARTPEQDKVWQAYNNAIDPAVREKIRKDNPWLDSMLGVYNSSSKQHSLSQTYFTKLGDILTLHEGQQDALLARFKETGSAAFLFGPKWNKEADRLNAQIDALKADAKANGASDFLSAMGRDHFLGIRLKMAAVLHDMYPGLNDTIVQKLSKEADPAWVKEYQAALDDKTGTLSDKAIGALPEAARSGAYILRSFYETQLSTYASQPRNAAEQGRRDYFDKIYGPYKDGKEALWKKLAETPKGQQGHVFDEMLAYDIKHDHPVTVDGMKFPSAERVHWLFLPKDVQQTTNARNAYKNWGWLTPFQKQQLGVKVSPKASSGWIELNGAIHRYEKPDGQGQITYPTEEQKLAAAQAVDKDGHPGFYHDYLLSLQPAWVRMSKAGIGSKASAPAWQHWFGKVAQFSHDITGGQHVPALTDTKGILAWGVAFRRTGANSFGALMNYGLAGYDNGKPQGGPGGWLYKQAMASPNRAFKEEFSQMMTDNPDFIVTLFGTGG